MVVVVIMLLQISGGCLWKWKHLNLDFDVLIIGQRTLFCVNHFAILVFPQDHLNIIGMHVRV